MGSVWILLEITKKFSDAWVKVTDTDGEFLLIEASGSLPGWLEPDVAENRVYINDGQLKIIKPAAGSRSAKRTEEKLNPAEARQIILKAPKRLMHSTLMEEEAFYRLRNYPQQINDNIHHALVTVPRIIAFLLKQNPAYIAPAVEAFYLRDPVSLTRLSGKTGRETLPIPPTDTVTLSVRFPKVAYAQLRSQDFPAPAALRDMMPAQLEGEGFIRAETAMKITCGFEMLLTDSQHQDKPAVREMKLLLEDLDAGEEVLPTDETMSHWEMRQDDEKWMDINFEDLENELDSSRSKPNAGKKREFGDKATHENLQRIVKQFEEFMNDEKAGSDGAGMFGDGDELDDDDDDLDDDTDDESGEDKMASFGEDDFTKLMQEMMGMPPEVMAELMKGELGSEAAASQAGELAAARTKTTMTEAANSGDGDEEFEAHMRHLEAELREKGALDLNASERALKGEGADSDLSDDDLDDNDIDINLAQNLLESLKAQAGRAGPGGNMLGMMGASLPRQDEEQDEEAGPSHHSK